MTLSFQPRMDVCAFILNGLCRYLKEHEGDEPVELVLHPEHKRMLREELRVPRAGVDFDGCEFNGLPILEAPCCRTPWVVSHDGQRWEL